MKKVPIVEIKEDITSRNNANAKNIREALRRKKIYYLNIMSSPGSGKTTFIVNLINRLKADYRIGVIETDIDSDVDARTVSEATGVKTVQIHTSGACHLTWQMSEEALAALGTDGLDIVILENIGNLVCPAEFDTGATADLVLLSVPEGDDKPLKYPLMFEVASAVAITKSDVMPAFDFSVERAEKNIRLRNGKAPIFVVSAAEDRGMDEAEKFIRKEAEKLKNERR